MGNRKLSGSVMGRFTEATSSFGKLSLIWLCLLLVISIYELIYNGILHEFPKDFAVVLLWSMINSVLFWFKWLLWLYIAYLCLFFLNRKLAKIIYCIFIVLQLIIQLSLIEYFTVTLLPLGADIYGYSFKDIKQTLASSGVNISAILIFGLFTALIIALLIFLPRRLRIPRYIAVILPLISLAFIATDVFGMVRSGNLKSEFANSLIINKSDHFYTASYNYFFSGPNETDIYSDGYIGDYGAGKNDKIVSFNYVDQEYPFLHADSTADVLSPFFNNPASPPNIVIILVEGLGRAFTTDKGYLGNFTPFIDSLSDKSLYWENFLSAGGRTFAVLPSLLGSLPFGKNGFLDFGESMPSSLSLLNILKSNGYHTSFYSGGDAHFDNMDIYLKKNNIDELNDGSTFPPGYVRLPEKNGFSWGYNDKELFRHYLATRPEKTSAPQLSVILTVCMHNPFSLNEADKYLSLFEQHMDKLSFNDARKEDYRKYKNQYSTILYFDDALRNFFSAYSKRSDFNNTIFLITGDHRMPEIPMRDKIDRFHVPMMIYSPLLKRTAEIASVSSHFDITPSLLAYLSHNYKIRKPLMANWLGYGLDTTRSFRNIHANPLIQTKTDMLDFVMGEYHLNGDALFQLSVDMSAEQVQDQEKLNQLKNAFDQFKIKNTKLTNGSKLIPDSIFNQYNTR